MGLFPNINDKPDLVYDTITANMIVCDVIPNPPHTPFLKEAEARGARTLDGLGMLGLPGRNWLQDVDGLGRTGGGHAGGAGESICRLKTAEAKAEAEIYSSRSQISQ